MRHPEIGENRTQSDNGVPSSANWNPTKPLMRRQQYAAATKPVYEAANHYNTPKIVNDEDRKKAKDSKCSPGMSRSPLG